MSNLGWSRREQPASTSKPSGVYGTLAKLNPFNSEGYVRLPVHESDEAPGAPLPARTRREEEEGWFARKSYPSTRTHTLVFSFWKCSHSSHHEHESRGGRAYPSLSHNLVLADARHCILHLHPQKTARGHEREFLRPAARCMGPIVILPTTRPFRHPYKHRLAALLHPRHC